MTTPPRGHRSAPRAASRTPRTRCSDDTFLVISGDALTDFDLTDLISFHRKRSSLVTVCLTRVPNPLEFGITIVDDDGKVQRFLEKPTWGQVFSDTVNTGIYVMEPEVFDHVAAGESVDWSGDVFPALLKAGAPIYGYVAEGYWEDVGTHESYMKAQADVLDRKVDVDIDGFEISPGVWVAEGAEVDPDAKLLGPLYIGDYAKVEAAPNCASYTVLGSNVVVQARRVPAPRRRARQRVHRPGHKPARLRDRQEHRHHARRPDRGRRRHRRRVRRRGGGDRPAEVKVYPFKTIEAGAVVNTSVIWESRGQRNLFGPRGVSGIVNVEITPELVVRLCAAFATTLKKGATVTTSRDVSRAARALKRAVISALNTSAPSTCATWRSCRCRSPGCETARGSAGGIMIRTTPGQPESVDIMFLDERGADLSQVGAAQARARAPARRSSGGRSPARSAT